MSHTLGVLHLNPIVPRKGAGNTKEQLSATKIQLFRSSFQKRIVLSVFFDVLIYIITGAGRTVVTPRP